MVSILVCMLVMSMHGEAFASYVEQDVQQYIDKAPFDLDRFLKNPIEVLWNSIQDDLLTRWKVTVLSYKEIIGLLLLGGMLQTVFFSQGAQSLVDWLMACGCFFSCGEAILAFAGLVGTQCIQWRDFMLGYIPVYSALICAAGTASAAIAYSGYFFTGVNVIANTLNAFIVPAVQSFLAVSIAGVLSGNHTLAQMSGKIGGLIQKLFRWICGVFLSIFGMQQIFASVSDSAALGIGRSVLSSTIPIVGQTLSGAVAGLASGAKLLQGGMLFSAAAVLGVQFLPLYLEGMLHLFLLRCCEVTAMLLNAEKSATLMGCIASGTSLLVAVYAMFFFMVISGSVLAMVLGGRVV